jgi:dihydrolipoamide dehydrogenase
MEKNIKTHDIAILGGGPGGYVGAIRAAKLGLKAAVIEEANLGGVCLNWGCIPTKSLYHIAETIESIKKAALFGIEAGSPRLDFAKAMARKDDIVEMQRRGLAFHFKKNGIELVSGKGKLISPDTIAVKAPEGKEIKVKAKNIIIATGSSAANVPPFDLSEDGIMDNKGILSLKKLPGSLLIVGGGVVGSEFANIFAAFGTRVTIVELLPRILTTEDEEVSKVIYKALRKKGVDIYTSAKVEESNKKSGKFELTLSSGEKLKVEKILVSVGRGPNSGGIGLEDIGVATDDKGYIKVNEKMQTNVKNVYAIGDVTGGLQLAHVASEEGKIASEVIAGKDKFMDYSVIPWAVFTSPEIGTVGLNTAQAKQKGYDVCVGSFPFANSGKAYITGETEGFINIVTEKGTGEILGAQMVGPRASDLVHEVAVAMKGEMLIDDLSTTVHSHPTLSEAVMEAAEDCFGVATHKSR